MKKVKVSVYSRWIAAVLTCILAVCSLTSQSVFASSSWHSLMIRSAWERDNQEMGGDGTQIPRCMVWSPKNNYQTVFFGVDTAGIYRSDDGGLTWNIKMNGLKVTYVKSMAVDPVNPDVVYALGSQFAYVPNAGLYMSTDNGENWSLHRKFNIDSAPSNAHAIAIDPTTYDAVLGRCKTMFVGTSSGLFKTVDGGTNWSSIGNDTIGNSVVASVTVHPGNHNLIMVGTYMGVFKSSDGGSSFENISDGLPTYDSEAQVEVDTRISSLACDPNAPDRMYATFEDPLGRKPRLFKKTGNTPWQEIGTSDLPGSGIYYDIMVHPAAPNKLLLGVFNVTGLGARYYSEDYGATWSKRENKVIEPRFNLEASSFAHRIRNFTAFVPHPTDPNVWLSALNFGAIYKTTDSCNTWVWSSNNFSGAAMVKFSFSQNNPRHMYFGGFDLGGLVSFDGGQSFADDNAVKHGKVDVLASAIDPDAPVPETATVYASIGNNNAYTTGQLEISSDGGRNFADVPGTFGTQDTEVFFHPTNHQYIYAGDYISKDHGVSWQRVYDNYIYSESFESTEEGTLPTGWSSTAEGTGTSSVAAYTYKSRNTVNKRLTFAIQQTSAQENILTAVYQGKAFDFTETPLIGEATLYPGATGNTSQTLRLTNQAGSFVDVIAESNGDGTFNTKYRVVDLPNFDWGEILIANSVKSSYAAITAVLAPGYLKIVITDESKNTNVRTVYRDFSNKTNYQMQILGKSSGTPQSIVMYADNVKFWKAPIQIFSADPVNPEIVYAYDGVSLYKSTNCGINWIRLITFHYDDNGNNYLQWQQKAAAMDRLGEYIFIGNRDGIYKYHIPSNTYTVKSYNNGFIANNDGRCDIRRVRTDPNDENIVYAGEVNMGGVGVWIFKSTDRGETWSQMSQEGLVGTKRVLSMDLDYSGRLWVGTYHGTFWYGDAVLPDAPGGLTASESGGNVSLSWSPAAGAVTYQVKRSSKPGGPYKVVQGGVVGNSFVDTTAESGVKNYYIVSAGNLAGESAASGEASVTVPVRMIYGSDFTCENGKLPDGWVNAGTTGNNAEVYNNRLRHTINQTTAWTESVAKYTQRAYDFSDRQLTVKATLAAGTAASSKSAIRLRDASKSNYIVVNQLSDKRISVEIKDGSFAPVTEYFGPYELSENNVTLEVTVSGLRVYKDDTLLKNLSREWTNKSDYFIELVGKTGTVGNGIEMYADNLQVWDVRLFPVYQNDFSGTNGSLPGGWVNSGNSGNVVGISDNRLQLTVNQTTAWTESIAKYSTQTYGFSSRPLTVQVSLDAGTTPSSKSAVRLRDASKSNYIVINQISDKRISLEIKDGNYVYTTEYFGYFDSENSDITLQMTGSGLKLYRGSVLLKELKREWVNTSGYYIELVGKSGTVGNNIYMYADNLKVWDREYTP